MSAWESVGSIYLEAAATAVPLHRLVTFISAFIGSLGVAKQTHLSIVETIFHMKLSEMGSFGSGILATATLGNVLTSIGTVILGLVVSRGLLWLIFTIAAQVTHLWDRVRTTVDQARSKTSASLTDKHAAILLIDSALEQPRARLRGLNGLAEMACGLAIGCVVASYWGNVVDVTAGFVFAMVGLALHVISVRLFFEEYFGPALYKAQLQGKPPPTALSAD